MNAGNRGLSSFSASIAVIALLLSGTHSALAEVASANSFVDGRQPLHGAEIADLPVAPQPHGIQQTSAESSTPSSSESLSLHETPKRILQDELEIITSPARLRTHDLRWLVPVAAASAAAFSTDSYTMRNVVSRDSGLNNASQASSSVLLGLAIGGPGILFTMGELRHKDHAREAGLLAGEAMADAFVLNEGVKYITLRQRPLLNDADGHFFSRDAASNPSFSSGHSIVAWSSAAVLAGEYNKPWQQAGIYTLASGVSLTRVIAQEHFPSDVLLGAVSGWLIGHYVYRSHRHSCT